MSAVSGKILIHQHKFMEDFYHGKSNHSPSQILMLVEGQLHYAALHETKSLLILSKKHEEKKKKKSTVQYYLKDALTRDTSRKHV